MALMAPVENGQIVETESQKSLKKQLTASKNGMDKEAFLQLLVAQMQYQDPLEPTSRIWQRPLNWPEPLLWLVSMFMSRLPDRTEIPSTFMAR